MRKIVITGPESTGKTTLASSLSGEFDSPWVPEYAVEYLEQLDRPYEYEDLKEIAKGHLDNINKAMSKEAPFLFCDTDLVNIRIWSEFKYHRVDPWIIRKTEESSTDLYLLCDIDIPWEPHPLREHPHLRETLFDLHKQMLKDLGKPFELISGTPEQRKEKAVWIIKNKLKL